MYLVTKENFLEALDTIALHKVVSFDTETTGLHVFNGDRLFSIIISTKDEDYYFNFNDSPDHLGNKIPSKYILPRSLQGQIFALLNSRKTIYAHNFKFDLKMLWHETGKLLDKPFLFCTQTMARLLNNQLPTYSLDALCKKIGLSKDKTVEEYIKKHKLYTVDNTGERAKRYDLVPFNIISTYGCRDGRITFLLGEYENNKLMYLANDVFKHTGRRLTSELIKNEERLIKTLTRLEIVGIKVDAGRVKDGLSYESCEYNAAAEEFEAYTGIPFVDGRTCLVEAFTKLNINYKVTDKGNPSFSTENLPDNPLSNIILNYRKHYKQANTYFKNFLFLKDNNDVIHCSFKQAGTSTGRMSCTSPNLQNVPKRSEDSTTHTKVRSCFVPREGYHFVMIDADNGEYKLLMDIAGETSLIEQVLNGLDVHTATANMLGITRSEAKTVNFALLYGTGDKHLAVMLGISLQEAKNIRALYFSKLPKIKRFIENIKQEARRTGYVYTPVGRKLINIRGQEYKIANHFIQGLLGDVLKKAMNNIDEYLLDKKSNLLLNIHDEVIIEVENNEKYIVKDIIKLMEKSYKYKTLPLTFSANYSYKDWSNKEELNNEYF